MVLGTEKVSFVSLPTPLDYLPTISKELGVEFYLKRDDMTNLGLGGNKLRKLEYLLKDARDQGATMLLTQGGVQTNHGRLTAAVAAKYGLRCAIVSVGEYPGEVSANILLDRIMGADVIIKKNDGRPESEQYAELVEKTRKKYEAEGEKVYYIGLGGSNEVGFLGYYECGMELTAQGKERGLTDATVYAAVGSLGTFMGLYCGLKNEDSPLDCAGIAIMPFSEQKEEDAMKMFKAAKEKYGLKIDVKPQDLHIEKDYVRGGYNLPLKEVRDAVYYMGRKEGILLDPCYTGKCFAGILDMIREGKIRQGEKIIMIHTGGVPGLYTRHHREEFEKELISGVYIVD